MISTIRERTELVGKETGAYAERRCRDLAFQRDSLCLREMACCLRVKAASG